MNTPDWQETCLSYIGRSKQQQDALSVNPTNCMLATLNDPTKLKSGGSLPPLFHWLYFNEPVLAENLKVDGHEQLGNFLPPVPYPRRMWAGSEVTFRHDLRLEQLTTKRSTIKSVTFKTGNSGALCFVKVEHVYQQDEQDCITDLQTIVYTEATTPNTPVSDVEPKVAQSERYQQSLNSVVLFRYSALTFNGHRIHYDQPYAREVEGYPGLVVHGPLMATLLMRNALFENPRKAPAVFTFRGMAPIFADNPFRIQSESSQQGLQLMLIKQDEVIAVKADLEWR